MPKTCTCVVVGGSGFLGQRLCERLLRSGFNVRSVSRSGRPKGKVQSWWSEVEWVAADLGSAGAFATLDSAELLFHVASSTYPSTSNADAAFDLQSNLLGSVRMLQAARARPVRRVIFISSGGTVYGIPRKNPISETHPTEPICSYGIHKLAIEKYLFLFQMLDQLDSIVLRVSNMYGECQDLERPLGAVSHFAHRAFTGKPIEIWGDGAVRRDYVHVDDVVNAFFKALAYEGRERIFNIGSARSVSLNELVELIRRRVRRRLFVTYAPPRGFDVPENVLDISRAGRELDWKPTISLETGLDRLLLDSAKPEQAVHSREASSWE
jgi:UDP-glucose 4-epimerase